MKQYYIYKLDGTQEGPYPEALIQACYIQGIYPEGTLIWSEGMNEWRPIHEHFMGSTPEENITATPQSKISAIKSRVFIIVVILIMMLHFHSRANNLLLNTEIGERSISSLCHFGANINTRDKYGKTPLLKHVQKTFKERIGTVLISREKWDFIQYIISEGADILAQDNKGNGIWHYFVIDEISRRKEETKYTSQDRRKYYEFFKKHSARLDDMYSTFWYDELDKLAPAMLLQNNRGETPFMQLWKSSYHSPYDELMYRILPTHLKDVLLDMTDKRGNTHLMWAAKINKTQFIYRLVEDGADVSAVNKKHQTALDIYKQSNPQRIHAPRVIRILQYGREND